MFISLSFRGILPSYIIESIHQIRIYFTGDVYLITDDIHSPFIESLKIYNVIIVPYEEVVSNLFIDTVNKNIHKFCILDFLIGREELFIRSFERFFLLQRLMEKYDLTDALFLELDNLIYDDPTQWIPSFSKTELCYMLDNIDRCSSGLMYVKSKTSLLGFMEYCINFINESTTEFMTEMTVLYRYYMENKTTVQILPTYWNNSKSYISELAYMNASEYSGIFDALGIGCYLLGLDTCHTGGIIRTGIKAEWCQIDYTQEKIEWMVDDQGRKRPYIWGNDKWLLINNLHVHSKDLKSGLSLIL